MSYEKLFAPVIDRTYVGAEVAFDRDGFMTPRAICWEDGRRFEIEAVESRRSASIVDSRLRGTVYLVLVKGQHRRLFYERTAIPSEVTPGRWWVEKTPAT